MSKLTEFEKEILKSDQRFEKRLIESDRKFKEALKEDREEDRKDREKDQKDREKEIKEGQKKFETELKQWRLEWGKKWGDLANKMGTLVEDIIRPGTRPAIRKFFKCHNIDISIYHERSFDGQNYELDLLALSKDKAFIVEAKTTVRIDDINNMMEKKLPDFHKFFPEYKHFELIPIITSIHIPESLIRYATKKNVYAMIWKEYEYLDIVNYEEIEKRKNS